MSRLLTSPALYLCILAGLCGSQASAQTADPFATLGGSPTAQPPPPPPMFGQPSAPQPPASFQQPAQQPATPAMPPQGPLPPVGLPPLDQEAFQEDERKKDFDAALQQRIGLTPDQIRQVRLAYDDVQRAASEPPRPPPPPKTGTLSVSLDPGSVPGKVHLVFGHTSAIVVMDATGTPWPVENFRVGQADAFAVDRMDGAQGSTFALTALRPYAHSNVVMKLEGVSSPVILDLVSGTDTFDARVEVRLAQVGPHARLMTTNLPASLDSALMGVLDGVPPAEGKAVTIEGGWGFQAWIMPDRELWVRSPLKIISPAATSMVRSANGMHMYAFPAVPRLMALDGDQRISLTVSGW